MSRAETKQHAESNSSFTPSLTQPRSHVGVGRPPRSPSAARDRAHRFPSDHTVEGGSPASAHRVVTGTHRQVRRHRWLRLHCFCTKKFGVHCCFVMCCGLYIQSSSLHRDPVLLEDGLQGPSNGAEHPGPSQAPGLPSAFSGEDACQWAATSNPP